MTSDTITLTMDADEAWAVEQALYEGVQYLRKHNDPRGAANRADRLREVLLNDLQRGSHTVPSGSIV